MRQIKVGIDFDRLAKLGDRFVVASRNEIAPAEIGVIDQRERIEFDGTFILRDSAIKSCVRRQSSGEPVVRIGVIWT